MSMRVLDTLTPYRPTLVELKGVKFPTPRNFTIDKVSESARGHLPHYTALYSTTSSHCPLLSHFP
jgi:hypothetical protein